MIIFDFFPKKCYLKNKEIFMSESKKNNLVKYRKRQNLTANQISKILEINEDDYIKMELGYIEPNFDMLKKLADFYNIDVYDLFNDNVENDYKNSTTYQKSLKILDILALSFISSLILYLFIFAILPYEYKYFGILSYFIYSIPWVLANNIVFVSSEKAKQGLYGFVTKIISMVFSSLFVLVALILLIKYFQTAGFNAYYLFQLLLCIVVLVFEILTFCFRKKLKK